MSEILAWGHRWKRSIMMKKKSATRKPAKKWSAKVTETSDAMTLQKSVFTKSPHAIALKPAARPRQVPPLTQGRKQPVEFPLSKKAAARCNPSRAHLRGRPNPRALPTIAHVAVFWQRHLTQRRR
jgi:hypothetical protein